MMSAQNKERHKNGRTRFWLSPTNRILEKAGQEFIAKLRKTILPVPTTTESTLKPPRS